METLNLNAFLAGLQGKVDQLEAERDNAVANGWYDKAAKLDAQAEAFKQAQRMANSGDYHAD